MSQLNACPTKQEILDATRAVLGDTRQTGGKLYSDEILELPLRAAVRGAFRIARNFGDFRVIRIGYTQLPANQNVLIPQVSGFPDFVAPIELRGRKGVVFYTVTNAEKNGRNLEVTVTPAHTIPIGGYAKVTATNIAGFPAVFGEYQGYAINDTLIRLLGCDVTGSWVTDNSAMNQIGIGTDTFTDIVWSRDIGNTSPQGGGVFSVLFPSTPQFDYTGGRFNFQPTDVDIQLRVRYYSSGTTPIDSNDVVEIPDCLDFLAIYTGMEATTTRMPTISKELRAKLWGNGREGFPDEGYARALAVSINKSQVNLKYADRTRPGYNTGDTPWTRL